jgi:hypothetical protein
VACQVGITTTSDDGIISAVRPTITSEAPGRYTIAFTPKRAGDYSIRLWAHGELLNLGAPIILKAAAVAAQ